MTSLNDDATVVCINTSGGSNKSLSLPPLDNNVLGRMIYVKSTPLSGSPGIISFFGTIDPIATYPNISFSNQVFQIIASSNNGPLRWIGLNQYRGCNVFSTSMQASTQLAALTLPFNSTDFFINSCNGPRAVLLPSVTTDWQNRFITIKDIGGRASSNPIFLSTPTGTRIDNFFSSIPIHHNFGSIDLFAAPSGAYASQWLILNYFNGTI